MNVRFFIVINVCQDTGKFYLFYMFHKPSRIDVRQFFWFFSLSIGLNFFKRCPGSKISLDMDGKLEFDCYLQLRGGDIITFNSFTKNQFIIVKPQENSI